jgi:hypothetical protein
MGGTQEESRSKDQVTFNLKPQGGILVRSFLFARTVVPMRSGKD